MTQLLLFEDFYQESIDIDDRYNTNISAPIYKPSNNKPNLWELTDTCKTKKLIKEIESSNVSDEEKKFLIEAAHRHSIFHYSKIADYYCNASSEMQSLMEKSALVIIDFNKAIENGYVKLSENIRRIQEQSARKTNQKK